MRSFLHLVAESLLRRYGTDMSRLTLVFPGKRASLFFEQALADLSPTPVWAPRYRTISDFFAEASPYTLCDTIEGVARLYRSYASLVEEPWPLDRFYTWGEILLSDFDDIDKHLVDPRSLFTNIADLHNLDDISYISPEQEAALRQFFDGFSIEATTEIKERFLRLWNHMADIHEDMQRRMRDEGVLYEGALQRDVIARLRAGEDIIDERRTFVFVGFNVLSTVEESLFDILERRHQALFFWDYDTFYVDNVHHEAGLFMRRNLSRYPNELTRDNFDNLRRPPEITVVATSSDNAQARYLPEWLLQTRNARAEDARENETAIVLANEQMLHDVLHAIPTEGDGVPASVNVTMGYPLADTPLYSLVEAMMTLQTDGYDAGRRRFRISHTRLLRHHPLSQHIPDEKLFRRIEVANDDSTDAAIRLIDYLIDALTELTREHEDGHRLTTLDAEALFQTYTALSRLRDLAAAPSGMLCVGPFTMRRLLRCVLQSRSIPFHGEPATGLQVMGLLETRTLDFTDVAILSTGEGFLPRSTPDSSFIPYALREAFSLTTLRHKIAVYAYYFYRLLQRAERVTLFYNESNSGLRQNEVSRFIRQLMAETDFPIRHIQLTASVAPPSTSQLEAPKPAIAETEDAAPAQLFLSPTAINAFTTCPMRYYYRFVEGLKDDHDPHDGLDANLFGQVFHRAAELLYTKLTERGDIVRTEDIEPYLQQGGALLDPIVRQAFRDAFFSQARDADGNVVGMAEEYTGILLIARDVVATYLQQLLRNDMRLTPFRILGLELKRYATIHVKLPATPTTPERIIAVRTGGIIDRLDEVSDPDVAGGKLIRIVDYKTGGSPTKVADLDKLFADTGQAEHHAFQTMLYAIIVAGKTVSPVAPCLFYVHRSGADDYSPFIQLGKETLKDIRPIATDFADRLRAIVADIFDTSKPFTQTSDTRHCRTCPYRRICGR